MRSALRIGMLCSTVAILGAETAAQAGDPTTADCLSANEQSIALGSARKLRLARAQALICGTNTCPADIRKECELRVDEINGAMPTIVFAAKDGAGNDLTAVKITMDGEPLADKLEGTALSVDPGPHTFVFEIAGQPPVTKQWVVQQGEKGRREAVQFGAPPGPRMEATPVPAPKPPEPLPVESPSGRRTAAYVASGVGIAGVLMGAITGALMLAKKGETSGCTSDGRGVSYCPTESARNAGNSARDLGLVSTIGWGAGIAGLGVGTALFFTAPKREGSSNLSQANGTATMGGLGLQLGGTW